MIMLLLHIFKSSEYIWQSLFTEAKAQGNPMPIVRCMYCKWFLLSSLFVSCSAGHLHEYSFNRLPAMVTPNKNETYSSLKWEFPSKTDAGWWEPLGFFLLCRNLEGIRPGLWSQVLWESWGLSEVALLYDPEIHTSIRPQGSKYGSTDDMANYVLIDIKTNPSTRIFPMWIISWWINRLICLCFFLGWGW